MSRPAPPRPPAPHGSTPFAAPPILPRRAVRLLAGPGPPAAVVPPPSFAPAAAPTSRRPNASVNSPQPCSPQHALHRRFAHALHRPDDPDAELLQVVAASGHHGHGGAAHHLGGAGPLGDRNPGRRHHPQQQRHFSMSMYQLSLFRLVGLSRSEEICFRLAFGFQKIQNKFLHLP